MADYVIQFLWGGAVLAALVGWGGVAARLAGWPETAAGRGPDWGLRAGFGMALLLVAGGALSLAGLARPALLIALVAIGALLFAADLVRRRPLGIESRWWLVLLAAVPLVLRYAGAVQQQSLSCGDDHVVYFAYVTRLLDTGTLIEPFGFRRLSAFGGQTFLQALVAAVGTAENAFLIDRGVAFVVSFGLVLGFFRAGARLTAGHWLAAIFLVQLVPIPVLNSSSHHTALALFLTLYRTLAGLADAGPPPARRLWLAGGVAAAMASLKATAMVAAVVAVAVWWVLETARTGAWRAGLGRLGHLALSGLAFLAPWMALMVRSSGTPLYPLFRGHHRPAFEATYAGGLPAGEMLAVIADFLSYPLVVLALAPLALWLFDRDNRAGLALYAGAVAATAATTTTLVHDTVDTLYRYAAPFLTAAFVAAVAYFIGRGLAEPPTTAAGRRGRAIGNVILAVAVLLVLPIPLHHDANRLADELRRAGRGPDDRAAYAAMQDAMPPGARVLVAVDRPYALDYRRNVILNVDFPGAASPDPGMPFFKGPAALKAYLKGQGIAYVAFRDFEAPTGCLYRRDLWRRKAGEANPMWRTQARYFFDFFDNVEALAATEKVVYHRDGLTVLALG